MPVCREVMTVDSEAKAVVGEFMPEPNFLSDCRRSLFESTWSEPVVVELPLEGSEPIRIVVRQMEAVFVKRENGLSTYDIPNWRIAGQQIHMVGAPPGDELECLLTRGADDWSLATVSR